MDRLIDLNSIPVQATLQILLKDKTTKKNIIWATNTYKDLGAGFQDTDEITERRIFGLNDRILQPRASKSLEEQKERTRIKAEVMTPSWLCNKMNNYADEDRFGYQNVFNTAGNNTWQINKERIEFPKGREWQAYIDSRRIEITCGEAPFLVSRYDTVTGEFIEPPTQRIGLLDRKLRVVGENTSDYDTWLKWAIRAFQSCYGYEYQGDSLLIARINMLMSFCDYHEARWNKSPDAVLLRKIANIIAWNLWQMDGLEGTTPLGAHYEEFHQLSLWEDLQHQQETENDDLTALPCVIKRWRSETSLRWEESTMSKKLFDFCIGNPPYQEKAPGESTSDKPIYHYFMDACHGIADKTELITPARYLFNAGATPKEWNAKMLSSEHFKVLEYESDAQKVFTNNSITGGIAISYYDNDAKYHPIETFVPYKELESIKEKVIGSDGFIGLNTIISGRTPYLFTDIMHSEHPDAEALLSKGHAYDVSSNAFSSLPTVFLQAKPQNSDEYFRVLGRLNNQRTYCWVKKQYIKGRQAQYTSKYKVFLPKANGASGMLGDSPARLISTPVVGEPNDIATDTFICVGMFNTKDEAEAALKYLQTKFARVLLGILKVTQINSRDTWRYVPLQDFTPSSDIDWSAQLKDIDAQLNKKYGLSSAEEAFIEAHVKELCNV